MCMLKIDTLNISKNSNVTYFSNKFRKIRIQHAFEDFHLKLSTEQNNRSPITLTIV